MSKLQKSAKRDLPAFMKARENEASVKRIVPAFLASPKDSGEQTKVPNYVIKKIIKVIKPKDAVDAVDANLKDEELLFSNSATPVKKSVSGVKEL